MTAMRRARRSMLLAALVAGVLCPAEAPRAWAKAAKRRAHVGRVVTESLKTGGRAARDGVLTFGRATRDFFTKGPGAAGKTWKANAAGTKATAKAGARAVRAAAKGN